VSPRTADRTLAVLGLVLVGTLAAWLAPEPESAQASPASAPVRAPAASAAARVGAVDVHHVLEAAAATPADELQAFGRWMAERSALRGTALDGGWGLDAQGQVRPSLALRRRFDHLLQLQGQAPLPRLSAWLAQQARQELSEADVQQVMSVWQAYLGLLASAGPVPRPDDGPALAAALDTEAQRRRAWLGLAWAEAFFGEDEAAWRQRQAHGPAPAEPLIDRGRLSPEAAQRLAEEEAEQARWTRRLAEARAELQRLRQAPELSAPQRDEAIARWLDERFAPGGERLRARALLGLPPS
jgi:lipase chaperone LimK